MRKDEDLLGAWLESRRLHMAATTGRRRASSGPSARLVRLLVGTGLFWPVVSGLLWLSERLLRLISRLYFSGWLAPRTARRLLLISGRPGRCSLDLMRRRTWGMGRSDRGSGDGHRP